ncbi:hypothetical protein JDV02_009140 [Purpureocillium takamizusanense]|uniref:Uncharacterized protein n=1 Tax=Purpureocillium takamizusanense TaxID=2060973 RepID=A0A9Q8QPB0_9HYPO|nr:uncharacterized protein JDV02_009140 [Purpureocillium takamizusanense]UNI23310.1 hypothetical protein JDV02_009140 [Purpureocillium takamizusanense]
MSICLGLAVASALKNNARELRWWLLSLGESRLLETDLILQSESLVQLVRLLWVTRRIRIRLFVIVWLALNLISQTAVALIGLTYNIDDTPKVLVTRPGMVWIPDMSEFTFGNKRGKPKPLDIIAQRYTANRFGSAVSFKERVITEPSTKPLEEVLPSVGAMIKSRDFTIYCVKDSGICRYVFREESVPDSDLDAMIATRRHVAVSTTCRGWQVLSGGDGLQSRITIDDGNKSTFGPLPVLNGPDQTLFMFDPEDPTASGDTWAKISVLEASNDEPWFYVCNNTIGPVVNAVLPEHEMSPIATQLASQAIALRGYGSSVTADNSTRLQFQSYPLGTTFGVSILGEETELGQRIAMFSVGAIGGIAIKSSKATVLGDVPVKSIRIEILGWGNLYAVLAFTIGFQALIAVSSALVVRRVRNGCRGHVAMTVLLRPALTDFDMEFGTADGGRIGSQTGGNMRLSYAPDDSGVYKVVRTA